MKNKKGFTLTEVLISIIILGILFGCIIGIIISSNNIERNIKQKTNTMDKIKETFDMFSLNPTNFIDYELLLTYDNNPVEFMNTSELTSYYKIYYDYKFSASSIEPTEWYFILGYTKDLVNGLYTLTIETYYKGEKVELVKDISIYTRTIKVV